MKQRHKVFVKILSWSISLLLICILFFFGISCFATTIAAYFVLYSLINWIIKRVGHLDIEKVIKTNLRIFFVFVIAIEFLIQFCFKFLNHYMEKNLGFYSSEYKRKEQTCVLKSLGFANARIAYEDGHPIGEEKKIHTSEFDYVMKIDQNGCRNKKTMNDLSNCKVVFLGDSYTEGFGSGDDSTISVLFEEKMNSKDHFISVYNAGIVGSDPITSIAFYKKKLIGIHPNDVFILVNLTDMFDIHYRYSEKSLLIPFDEAMYAVSHVYRIMHFSFLKQNLCSNFCTEKTKRKQEKYVQLLTNELKKFEEELRNEQCKLHVVYIPVIGEFKKQPKCAQPFTGLNQSLGESGISYFDLLSEMKKDSIITSYQNVYWPIDGHFTPKGNVLVSSYLVDWYEKVNRCR